MIKSRPFLFLLFLCILLLVAMLLWRYTYWVESEVSVPIKLENLPADLIIAGQPLKEVEVRIQGQKSILKALLEQKQTCVLDLAHATAGLVTLSVDASNLQFPQGISITHIEPTSITLRIEPKMIKRVPVVVTVTDNPLPGYRVVLTLAAPSTLQIIGPQKSLAQIDELVTQPVSVKDMSESFKKEIAVDLPSGVTVGSDGTPVVTAQVNIEENVTIRRFEDVPVEGRNTVLPVKITPPTIDIEVRGPENTLSSLLVGDDIKAYIDLEGLAPGTYARVVHISLTVGTTVAGYDPEVFTVTIGN